MARERLFLISDAFGEVKGVDYIYTDQDRKCDRGQFDTLLGLLAQGEDLSKEAESKLAFFNFDTAQMADLFEFLISCECDSKKGEQIIKVLKLRYGQV